MSMTNIFKEIKTSYFKSLRGEENFWVVLFGWGIGIYAITVFISFCLITALGKSGLKTPEHINSVLAPNLTPL